MDDDAGFIRALGERIFSHRNAGRLTVPEVATLTGIDVNRLASIERGSVELSMGELLRLARALGITPAELVAPV